MTTFLGICLLCERPITTDHKFRISSNGDTLISHAIDCKEPTKGAHEVTGEKFTSPEGISWKLDPGGKY